MAISKIILNGVTQIDLTQDTVSASTLMSPETAHGADGEPLTGTATPSSTTSRLILGAKNEVVTYAGPASGTVTLNASGAGTVNLPNGSYQFNGGTSGYVRTVTIDSNTTTIHVRPVGTIYWYGAWAENPVYTYASDPGVVDSDTFFTWTFPQNNAWQALHTNNDGAGFAACTLKYRGSYSTSYAKLGYGANSSTSGATLAANFVSYNTTVWSSISFAYTPDTTGKTIRLFGYKYNGRDYYLDIQEWYLGDR